MHAIMRTPGLVVALGAAIFFAVPTLGSAAEAASDDRWIHSDWDAVLHEHVVNGRVDYAGLRAHRDRLDAYLGRLERRTLDAFEKKSDDERLASWINAYNAFTVALILDHYPVDSIWKVTPFWQRISGGPFRLDFIPLGHLAPDLRKKVLSLDDIEHGIIRKTFDEPRIHFAVNCASKGCPILQSAAYRGEALDEQLDDAARGFLRDEAKNRYDAASHTLHVSPLFKWFDEDFESGGGAVGYFRRYGPANAITALDAAGSSPTLAYTDYDWSLNAREGGAP